MRILKIALQNFSAYKKHYFKLISAFVALVFLLTIFSTVSIAITDKYVEIKNKTVSSNYAISNVELENNKLSVNYHSQSITSVNIASRSEELFGMTFDYVTSRQLTLILNGNTFTSSDQEHVTVYSGKEWNIFTDNDFAELGLNNPDQFLIGRFPKAENEIVLSQEFLDCYNIPQDIIGQKIHVVSRRFTDRVILENVVVCGILTETYCNLKGHSNIGSWFSPSILVSADNNYLDRYSQHELYVISFSDWISNSDLEYLTSIDAQYVGKDSIDKIEYINNLQMIHKQIVLYVGVSLICGILLTIFLILEKLCTSTSKNTAMLMTVGTDKGALLLIHIVQLVFANLIALVIACPISIGVFEIINYTLNATINVRLSVSALAFVKLMAVGFASIACLTLLSTMYLTIRLNNKQIRDLM